MEAGQLEELNEKTRQQRQMAFVLSQLAEMRKELERINRTLQQCVIRA